MAARRNILGVSPAAPTRDLEERVPVRGKGRERGGGALQDKWGPMGSLTPNATSTTSSPRFIAKRWMARRREVSGGPPASPAKPSKKRTIITRGERREICKLRGRTGRGPQDNFAPDATLMNSSPRFAASMDKKGQPRKHSRGCPSAPFAGLFT